MARFDFIGAASFAHKKFTGPSRVLYWLLAMGVSSVLCALAIGLIVYVCSKAPISEGLSAFIIGALSLVAWVWATSFGAAVYEWGRELEPSSATQKTEEEFQAYVDPAAPAAPK